MAIIKYLSKLLRKDEPDPDLAYVHDEPAASDTEAFLPDAVDDMAQDCDDEIDLTRQADLEGYARDINVSKESMERWISSGLLMPEELKVAEKLIKIMRRH